MLENGFDREEKKTTNFGWCKLAKNSRWCYKSRYHCIFFILLFGAVVFLYSTNLKKIDWSHQWWKQYNLIKWKIPFKSWNHPKISPNSSDLSENTSGSSPESAALTNETRITTSLHAELPAPETTNLTEANLPPTGNTSLVTLVITQRKAEQTPIPYVSPGPYLVEYPYDYHFTVNEPEKCEQLKPFVVLIVPVAPHNRKARDIIRKTWGGETMVLGKVVTVLFLLGQQTGEEAEQTQQKVLQESREHRDLIQSDFLDCYKNLTIKTMVMLEWLMAHCSTASYAMKIDSDMFLNADNLIKMLLNAPKNNYMTGLVARWAQVLRDPNSKWYVPVELVAEPHYPSYALGLGYVLSLDLPQKLVEASRHVKALYIEDVYLGFCMKYLGIPFTDPPDGNCFHVFPLSYSRCGFSKIIATTTSDKTDLQGVWRDFKRPGPYC